MFKQGKLEANLAMQLLAGSSVPEAAQDPKRKHEILTPSKESDMASPPPKDPKTDKSSEVLDTHNILGHILLFSPCLIVD